MKSIFETLAALGTGAILVTTAGCGGSSAKAKEAPAAESKPAETKAEAPTETKTDSATAGATDKPAESAAPSAEPAPSAAPAAATPVKKTGNTAKKPGAKKGGADAKCGEGTCG